MTHYLVNATKTVCAWVVLEADSPEDALAQAAEIRASDFETDEGTAEVDFNVTPEVEVWS
jgi:hypothetical protein